MSKLSEKNNGVLGNTNPKPKRASASKYWCFTYNNYTEDDFNKVKSEFVKCNVKYIMGREVGEAGTPHIQGYIEAPTGIRPMEFFGLSKNIHWEKRKGSSEANLLYCSKESNFTTNMELPGRHRLEPRVDHYISTLTLTSFHPLLTILTLVNDTIPDRRKVFWVYDLHGGLGKTTWAKWMVNMHKDVCYVSLTKSNDIAMAARDFYKTYIIDIARTNSEFGPFTAIEQLKNGFIQDAKLKKEIRTTICAPPHIFILSNALPDRSRLSEDRWMIYTITKNSMQLNDDPPLKW